MAIKKYIYIITLIFSFISLPSYCFLSAVTYDFSGGRFGDCLLSYCHAKWIAHIHKMPLLYKPFEYSDQLKMHELEILYSDELASQFNGIKIVCPENLNFDRNAGFLYIIPFFPESIFNRNDAECPYLFSVDWNDAGFKAQLQKMICPAVQLQSLPLPEGVLTVAIHIRKGTGWDIPNYQITPEQLTASHPLRFAPDSFYINQLKRVVKMFPDRVIYAYLFTDHNNPAELAQKYMQEVACDHLIIDYRKTENNEFINVLDDFFALTHFDCLIRADSNYSFIASKIADFKIIVSPWHGVVENLNTFIDEINLEINDLSFILKEKYEE